MFRGKAHLGRAVELRGNMLYSALLITRARYSTEFGSGQQHLEALDLASTGARSAAAGTSAP
jgi:hypothetical protein